MMSKIEKQKVRDVAMMLCILIGICLGFLTIGLTILIEKYFGRIVQLSFLLGMLFWYIVIEVFACRVVLKRLFKRMEGMI